jgi:hypothetical protein
VATLEGRPDRFDDNGRDNNDNGDKIPVLADHVNRSVDS